VAVTVESPGKLWSHCTVQLFYIEAFPNPPSMLCSEFTGVLNAHPDRAETEYYRYRNNCVLCQLSSKAAAGKMVPFAGWAMPIMYKDSIMDASNWCRTNCSIFDVSHMCGMTLKVRPLAPSMVQANTPTRTIVELRC
jgi:hypothetical protein